GLDGHITYSRSTDEGATWNPQHSVAIPGMDSTLYAGMGADAYSIDARGDVVAFTSGRIDIDWAMWKSTDNGTTWTKTVVQQWPFPLYDDVNGITDVDGDGIADTVQTTDGKVAILIDQNDMVHVWAGAMLVFDDVVADPLGLFLSTDGLLYWNESMGTNAPVVIAQSPDRDGDGMLTFAADYAPRYGNGGQTSQPSAALDPFGNIIVAYITLMENTTSGNPPPGDFSYRNIFMIGSEDGGTTWGTPFNVSNSDFDEAVFGSVAKTVNAGCVDIVWQQDGLPGIAVQAPDGNQALHPFGNNDMIHDCIDITNVVSGIKENTINGLDINVYPNPASDFLVLNYTLENATSIKVEIRNTLGQIVKEITDEKMLAGEKSFTVDISDLRAGVYTLNTISGSAVVPNRFIVE
ncbi:MAG: T9SS type A sorting domain-containing protein, partial [Bacteroidia bacterium]|nr:T9SS type A sorting domain-containing protein [Bacteroidia bacterium]